MSSIPENAITGLLPHFSGYDYSLGDARYPYDLSGISVPGEPPKLNNCCTFVEALLVKAWADTHGDDFTWNMNRHRQMMITGNDFYSPITAIVETEMGTEADPDEFPQPWMVVQGWKKSAATDGEWFGGHAFLILDSHPESQRVLTLESNKAFGMNGPGFRNHGDLDSFETHHPGSQWFENERIPTWTDFMTLYPYMKLAKLHVDDVGWVAAG